MAIINCPICDVTLMESDPSGQMNTVATCGCDLDQIVYIATDSDLDTGIAIFDGDGDAVDYMNIDGINRRLGTSFQRSVRAYYPIRARDLIDEMETTWYDGCECFGRFDEPGCYSCAIRHPRWITPVEIHLTTWDDKTKPHEHVVGFVDDDLRAFDEVHLQHGALMATDGIPEFEMSWGRLNRILSDANLCTLNRRNIR